MHLDVFFLKRENDIVNDNVMVEENIFNKLIAMESVSGLADRSTNFAKFLTAARKFNF